MWRVRILATVLVLAAFVLHCVVAARRSAGLLEHDEAISLLAAAGKAEPMARLHGDPYVVDVLRAADLQDFLRPTAKATVGDVISSLARCDMHPPLYFLILHGLGRAGVDGAGPGRVFGTLVLFIGVWCANRWIWPQASTAAKLLGAAWLLLTPTMLDIATELRQYALVYLGVLLSIAALVKLWEDARPARHTFMLLAVAPVILVWSQYGTALWVAFGLLMAVAGVIAGRGRQWKLVAGAVAAAAVLLSPVLVWGYGPRLAQVLSPEPLLDAGRQGFLPICRAVADAWCPIPWSLQSPVITTAMAALVLLACAVPAWLGGRSIDRWLWGAAVAWGAAWLLLLAGGRIPPHAVEAKQLAPLVLVPACLIARAGSAVRPRWVRGAAVGVLAISLLAQAPRLYRLLTRPNEDRLIAALGSTECLLADAPRRGYLLPLVEKMQSDARVVIAGPHVVLKRWEELERLLPEERLLLAEIKDYPDQGRSTDAQQVVDRLSELYQVHTVVWQGPRRTVTEISKKKRTAVSSHPSGRIPGG